MTEIQPVEDEGAFSVSPVCGYDADATRAHLVEAGLAAHREFMQEAMVRPEPLDEILLRRIHRAWFETAFPKDAGVYRKVDVFSRRGTVSPAHAITENVASVLHGMDETWVANGGDRLTRPFTSDAEIATLISVANEVALRLHYVHPFRDGNTRSCLLLRRYLLQRAGLRAAVDPLVDRRSRDAWNKARPGDHKDLDFVLTDQLGDGLTD